MSFTITKPALSEYKACEGTGMRPGCMSVRTSSARVYCNVQQDELAGSFTTQQASVQGVHS